MKIAPKLTRDYLLKHINEIDIFAKYLRVNEFDIYHAIKTNTLIPSPLRDNDTLASFGFYYKKRRVRGRDFGGWFWGDCFDLVGFLTNKNPNRDEDFISILNTIARDFKLIPGDVPSSTSINPILSLPLKEITKEKLVIQITTRTWNKDDNRYWARYYLYPEDLSYFHVYPVDQYWINPALRPVSIYQYRTKDPCYAYYFGKDNNGRQLFKLYFPRRPKSNKYPRFISNSDALQGLHTAPIHGWQIIAPSSENTPIKKDKLIELQETYPSLLITKSYKDVMVIKKMLSLFPEIKDIEGHYVLFDYDNTGIRNAMELVRNNGFTPLFLTDGIWKRGKGYFGCKDFSDFLFEYKKSEAIRLINNTINTITNDKISNFGLYNGR